MSNTPSQAKVQQKQMKKKHKKTIVKRKVRRTKSNIFVDSDEEDRKLMATSRDSKMTFEVEKHRDMKQWEEKKSLWEEKKINTEIERLGIEKDTLQIKHETMIAQNSLEKSKIMLLRLEMFKEQQVIKKNNPDVMDDYLNELLCQIYHGSYDNRGFETNNDWISFHEVNLFERNNFHLQSNLLHLVSHDIFVLF